MSLKGGVLQIISDTEGVGVYKMSGELFRMNKLQFYILLLLLSHVLKGKIRH